LGDKVTITFFIFFIQWWKQASIIEKKNFKVTLSLVMLNNNNT